MILDVVWISVAPQQTPSWKKSKKPARGRILVVDDEAMYAEMLYGILRQHHYKADMFTDSNQAFEMIVNGDYQLIVTDYQMPGLNGVQLVEKVRAAGLSIPIIIISGMMNTPELQRAVNMGITLSFAETNCYSRLFESCR